MWNGGCVIVGIRPAVRMAVVALAVVVGGCSGPDTGDDADPTRGATETSAATATNAEATSTLSMAVDASPTQEPTSFASPTERATPIPAPASPTVGASPPRSASPTAVAELRDILPGVDELPGEGYIIAEEGARTAQELANAYADPAAHLQRLNEWGFRRHVFRAFTRDSGGENDQLPTTILTTVNEYGSPEQADEAIDWLARLARTQGATEAEGVSTGDRAEAFTIPTADGYPTASIYIRSGASVLVYYGEGGDPLPALMQIATAVSRR